MSKKKKKKNRIPSALELYQRSRRDWGGINPVTRIIPNKKKKEEKRRKHRDLRAEDYE